MANITKYTTLKMLAAIAAIGIVAGCSSATPTLDTSAEAEQTFDGLFPISGSRADHAWARPGVDISQYTKIRLQGVGIEYRPGGESGLTYTARTSADHFEVTEQQRARFEEVMREAFRDELTSSKHFTLVEENGPDVLLVMGGLLDVVSYVPPETASRSEVFLSRVGEATLVLEIRDSITQATLARVVDRRAAESVGGQLQNSNRAMNRNEVRRLARFWAGLLRDRLDELASAEG